MCFSNILYVVVFLLLFLLFTWIVSALWPYLLGSHSLNKHCLDVNHVCEELNDDDDDDDGCR